MSPNLLPLTLSLVLISVPSWALLNPDLELELDGGPGQDRELVDGQQVGQERQPQNGPGPGSEWSITNHHPHPLPSLLPPAPLVKSGSLPSEQLSLVTRSSAQAFP